MVDGLFSSDHVYLSVDLAAPEAVGNSEHHPRLPQNTNQSPQAKSYHFPFPETLD